LANSAEQLIACAVESRLLTLGSIATVPPFPRQHDLPILQGGKKWDWVWVPGTGRKDPSERPRI
jgi:hypothetical protein